MNNKCLKLSIFALDKMKTYTSSETQNFETVQ